MNLSSVSQPCCEMLWFCRTCVCACERKAYPTTDEKGSKAFKSIIAIIIIMITTIIPVYCNIIDALVQVTYLIFLQRTLMK